MIARAQRNVPLALGVGALVACILLFEVLICWRPGESGD